MRFIKKIVLKGKIMSTELMWHTMDDLENYTSKKQVQAQCLTMWGNCYLEKPPNYFGNFMVKAGGILGYPALPENLKEGKKVKTG